MSLAGLRIRMAAGESGDGLAETAFGIGKAAAFQRAATHRDVTARVSPVTPQRLLPVKLGGAGGMSIEVEMLAGEIEFVRRRDFLRWGRFAGQLAVELEGAFVNRAIGQQAAVLAIENRGGQLGRIFPGEFEVGMSP